MKKETKVVQADFKDKELFCIKEIEDGEPSKYPIHNFGIKKAKILLDHLEELQEFVKENDK